MNGRNRAVFFERDGILNLVLEEKGQQVAPVRVDQLNLNLEFLPTLERLKKAGFKLIATTNQPGIGLGTLNRFELERMHELLQKRLQVDGIMVCPHTEADYCDCRKPKQGLFTEAAFKWRLDMSSSFVVSDKWQDATAAFRAECTSILVQSPWIGGGRADFIVPNLEAVGPKIIELDALRLRGQR